LKIPQLKRLIICKNETVIMEPTLEEGFARLGERFQNRSERARRRLQELEPGTGKAPIPPGEEKQQPQTQPQPAP
jgi:hypothetical protein